MLAELYLGYVGVDLAPPAQQGRKDIVATAPVIVPSPRLKLQLALNMTGRARDNKKAEAKGPGVRDAFRNFRQNLFSKSMKELNSPEEPQSSAKVVPAVVSTEDKSLFAKMGKAAKEKRGSGGNKFNFRRSTAEEELVKETTTSKQYSYSVLIKSLLAELEVKLRDPQMELGGIIIGLEALSKSFEIGLFEYADRAEYEEGNSHRG